MKVFAVLKSLLKSLPVQLLLIILFVALFGKYVDEDVKRVSLAISISLKEVLVALLPIMIFAFISSCLISFGSGTIRFIISLLGAVVLSNYLSTVIAYFIGSFSIESVCGFSASSEQTKELVAYWSFSIPVYINNAQGLIAGLVYGIIFGYVKNDFAVMVANKLSEFSMFFLEKIFIPLVPIFILGFIFKLEHEGSLVRVIKDYCQVLGLIAFVQISYVVLMYGIAASFKPAKWLELMKNAFPSLIVAISTMSSAASMPFVLEGVEQNTNHSKSARAIVSSTINFHMIGDNFTVVILALAVLVTFGQPIPTFSEFFIFSLYFTAFRFAVAAVPGGGIIVMTGLLSNHLGFSTEMISLITALYILFDGIITMTNVFGNGAFPVLFLKVFKRFR